MHCACQNSWHLSSCWHSPDGYYLNGVKIAPPPKVIVIDPSVVTPGWSSVVVPSTIQAQ